MQESLPRNTLIWVLVGTLVTWQRPQWLPTVRGSATPRRRSTTEEKCKNLIECSQSGFDQCVTVMYSPYRNSPYQSHKDIIESPTNASSMDTVRKLLFELSMVKINASDSYIDVNDTALSEVLEDYLCVAKEGFGNCMKNKYEDPPQCSASVAINMTGFVRDMWRACVLSKLDAKLYNDSDMGWVSANLRISEYSGDLEQGIQQGQGEEWVGGILWSNPCVSTATTAVTVQSQAQSSATTLHHTHKTNSHVTLLVIGCLLTVLANSYIQPEFIFYLS